MAHIRPKPFTMLAALLAALAAVAAFAGQAHAARIQLGLSEQGLGVFDDVRFQKLGITHMRGFAPWNVALSARDRDYLDAWLTAVRARGIEPLVTFTAASGSRCPARPCKLPSTAAYTRAFKAFRKRWPWVRSISPWNEANQRSQPTFRHPKAAARFYNVVRARCHGCRIVAADVIDDPNMVRWLGVFRRYAKRPRIWGLHNYRDVNPRRHQRYGGTERLLRTVRGQVWLTETGGIVKFVLPGGQTLFRSSERRANLAMRRMLSLARRYRSRIRRVYVYHWRQPSGPGRFDAGLLRANGKPRPSYYTFLRALRSPFFRS
ncbi:MAG TPA: hypothetical protein VGF25_08095 [Thermoleophilaceae bacterium]